MARRSLYLSAGYNEDLKQLGVKEIVTLQVYNMRVNESQSKLQLELT